MNVEEMNKMASKVPILGKPKIKIDDFEFNREEIEAFLPIFLVALDPTEKQKDFLENTMGLNIVDNNGKQFFPVKNIDKKI